MSGTGHKADCNKNALFVSAQRALSQSRSLRGATSHALGFSGVQRPSIVLPKFDCRPSTVPAPASHLVAIAFSAGGLQPVIQVLHSLPSHFPAAVAIAHHVGDVSCLPELLRNQTGLAVKFAESGEPLIK